MKNYIANRYEGNNIVETFLLLAKAGDTFYVLYNGNFFPQTYYERWGGTHIQNVVLIKNVIWSVL